MNIKQITARLDEIENRPRKSIFESIGHGDQYFIKWERDIHPILCEVALQPDQIQQLFKSIETGAGRSMLGKAGDAVKGAADKISDVWFNKFGGMLQSSGPVQAFDQKFEEIKSSIAAKNPELATKLAKYGEFAKANPNLHKFLLAIAGSAAAALGVAVAGGVGAGALAVGTGTGIAVGILNIADRLLQGQKASTAIGRGATTGVIAGLAAGAAAKIGDMVKAGLKSDVIADLQGMRITKHTMDHNGAVFSAVTKEPETSALKNAFDALMPKFGTGGAVDPNAVNKFAEIMSKVSSPEYQEMIGKTREVAMAAKAAAKSSIALVGQLQQVGTAAAGGIASAATNQQTAPTTESLNRNQLNELFGITGNKVDASTLQKAWVKAGSPTDSNAVAKILQDAGVDPAVVSKSYTDMGIAVPAGAVEPTLDQPAPAATPTDPTATSGVPASDKSIQPTVNISSILDQIKKLDLVQQKQILAYLKK
jgi:hypothetical protein